MQRQAAVALRLHEVRDRRGQKKRRDTMKLITASELANKSLSQLQVLYRMISDELYETEPCSIERANMIASLEVISRAMTARRVSMSGPKF
jgi:hypothetical protein